jgi:lysophospholipase L1-like esterase
LPVVDASPLPIPIDQLGTIAVPNPLVSHGKPVTSSLGSQTNVDGTMEELSSINSGDYEADSGFEAPVSAGTAPWVAMNVGAGPTRLLLTWLTLGQVNAPTMAPVDYHIDVSPDGTTWTTVVTVTGNDTNAREDSFDFTNQAWVRIVTDKADSSGEVHFVQLEAYDISKGSQDTWVFVGDSITADAMNLFVVPDFAALIKKAKPSYTPMVIDEAIGGTSTTDGLATIDTYIGRFPDVTNFAVAYGTNDSVCDLTGAGSTQYIKNLKTIVDKLKAAGKRVIIPQIPWNHWATCSQPTDLAPYNAAIDTLQAADAFVSGPDLYTFFSKHQSELTDGVHPGDAGVTDFNQLWSTAVLPLYP